MLIRETSPSPAQGSTRKVSQRQFRRSGWSNTLFLKSIPSDIAFKKTDSAKVIVTDIIVGGGLYEYYFRYRITNRAGVEEEIKPELLFSNKTNN